MDIDSIGIQEQIKSETKVIEILETALSELRSKQADYDRAADAVSNVLDVHYRKVAELRALLPEGEKQARA